MGGRQHGPRPPAALAVDGGLTARCELLAGLLASLLDAEADAGRVGFGSQALDGDHDPRRCGPLPRDPQLRLARGDVDLVDLGQPVTGGHFDLGLVRRRSARMPERDLGGVLRSSIGPWVRNGRGLLGAGDMVVVGLLDCAQLAERPFMGPAQLLGQPAAIHDQPFFGRAGLAGGGARRRAARRRAARRRAAALTTSTLTARRSGRRRAAG